MKPRINPFLSCLLALICADCSGTSLIESSSSENDAAKTLTIEAIHRSSDENGGGEIAATNGAKTFANDLGITVRLEKADVSWGHLFLISGDGDEECEAGHDAELHLETIENLLDADLAAIELATDEIEDRAYCDYAIELTSDNSDTEGADETPEIAGRSVYVAGTWANGTDSGSFEIAVDEDIRVEAGFQALENGGIVAHPFHFHEGEEVANVTFENVYDAWFDGMTFMETAEDAATLLKTNVAAALSQRIDEDE